MTDSPPPRKRARYDIPVYYYALGTTVIQIMCLDPDRDLKGFRGALSPELYENIDPGVSEDYPLWVPPCMWPVLLKSPNPIIIMAETNMKLANITIQCRDKWTLAIVNDLGTSMHKKASDVWTRIYDRIVDNICQDTEPSNDHLPYPEPIISIARYVDGFGDAEERCAIHLQYPELFLNDQKDMCPLWAMREVVTATGSRKRWLTRVMNLFGHLRLEYPKRDEWPDLSDAVFDDYLFVYWRWRDYKYKEREAGMYRYITSNINCRYANLYENTRALFAETYGHCNEYFFKGEYNHQVLTTDTYMVDRETGKIIDLATAEDIWTPALFSFLTARGITYTLPAAVVQRALRQLPSADVATFSRTPFRAHALFVYLLNANPVAGFSERITTGFDIIEGVPSEELYWSNLDVLAPNRMPIDFLQKNTMPTSLRDPDKKYACFLPALQRVLCPRQDTFIAKLYWGRIELDPMPLGGCLDKILRATHGKGRYSINSKNLDVWRFLKHADACHLFPVEVQRVFKRVW